MVATVESRAVEARVGEGDAWQGVEARGAIPRGVRIEVDVLDDEVAAILLGLAIGVFAAVRQGTRTDSGVMILSFVGVSTPQFVAGILMLIPAAISLDWRMALILGALAATYTVLNVVVMRKTAAGQAEVESHDFNVSGRVGDVVGNVTVVQSYARLAAEATTVINAQDYGRTIYDLSVRRALLTAHGIEIGGALGPLAGRIWRVGLMGAGATRANLLAFLDAFEDVLAAAGHALDKGAAVSAASRALA